MAVLYNPDYTGARGRCPQIKSINVPKNNSAKCSCGTIFITVQDKKFVTHKLFLCYVGQLSF
jgi:hypothetical protein